MDGTLIDSMPTWRGLGKNFLVSRGITPPVDLRKIIAPMTLEQSAQYFKTLGVQGETGAIVKALNSYMRTQYETAIRPRQNAARYLDVLKAAGVRCCVATATDETLARTCLKRLDLLKYFEFIVSCEDIGVGKTSPAVYHAAAQRLGAEPTDIAVYEDIPYAAQTAKHAGYYTVGIYDPSSELHQESLKQTVDEYIVDYAVAATALRGEMLAWTFTDRLHKSTESIWAGFHDHPFVKGIGDGTLDIARFRFFLVQDYVYLFEYAKVFALGVAKAKKPAHMRRFAKSVAAVLNDEMMIHKAYMKRLGIDDREAEAAKPALANSAYTSYMLSVGFTGDVAAITAAILACSWSYAEIGLRLNQIQGAAAHPLYGEWISGYCDDTYQEENRALIALMNALAEGRSAEDLAYLEEVFINCSRHEAKFWDMAWKMED